MSNWPRIAGILTAWLWVAIGLCYLLIHFSRGRVPDYIFGIAFGGFIIPFVLLVIIGLILDRD